MPHQTALEVLHAQALEHPGGPAPQWIYYADGAIPDTHWINRFQPLAGGLDECLRRGGAPEAALGHGALYFYSNKSVSNDYIDLNTEAAAAFYCEPFVNPDTGALHYPLIGINVSGAGRRQVSRRLRHELHHGLQPLYEGDLPYNNKSHLRAVQAGGAVIAAAIASPTLLATAEYMQRGDVVGAASLAVTGLALASLPGGCAFRSIASTFIHAGTSMEREADRAARRNRDVAVIKPRSVTES